MLKDVKHKMHNLHNMLKARQTGGKMKVEGQPMLMSSPSGIGGRTPPLWSQEVDHGREGIPLLTPGSIHQGEAASCQRWSTPMPKATGTRALPMVLAEWGAGANLSGRES
ncbi:MAG TPA: hypothetical protein DCZ69_08440 [Syntrophobacteraceae bacterium]|nr:hypothetical protein [Syntrophobacteraceae bacterium]